MKGVIKMFDLAGEVALVTGGAKGIGKGIAKALKQARAKVIIGDIDKNRGGRVDGNLSHVKDLVDYTIQSIYEEYGKISILCSNAGIFPRTSIEKMTEKDWDEVQNINMKGTFFVTKAALKYMKKQSYGRVILTSSITGPITGLSGWAHYGASKSAQLGFMRSAAIEYAKYGITVNAIQPGNIISDGLLSMENSKSYMNQIKEIIPVYTLGKPEDIGYTAVFLASREAGFITGQTIVVDGGQVLLETLTFI